MSRSNVVVISRRMARFAGILAVAIPVLNVAFWFFPVLGKMPGGIGVSFGLTDYATSDLGVSIFDLPWWLRAGGIAITTLPLLALASGLRSLSRLFGSYAREDYFSSSAAGHVKTLGKLLVLWVILSFILQPVLTVWLTLLQPPGQHILALSFNASQVITLFLAGCVAVIGHILEMASRMADENRKFV